MKRIDYDLREIEKRNNNAYIQIQQLLLYKIIKPPTKDSIRADYEKRMHKESGNSNAFLIFEEDDKKKKNTK